MYVRGTDCSPAVRLGKGNGHSLSHDGWWAVATVAAHTLILLPTGAGQPRRIPSHGITAYSWEGFFPGDKRILFAGTGTDGGMRMYAQDLDGINVASGKRTLLHQLVPGDQVGTSGISASASHRMDPDMPSDTWGTLHNLYQLTGLRQQHPESRSRPSDSNPKSRRARQVITRHISTTESA